MTIVSQAQARYSAALLAAISNPQEETATTADAGRMALAELDVKGYFLVWANEVYDETKGHHVAAAVKAWVALLQIYTGQAGDKGDDMYKLIESDLKAVAKIGARDRISATSTSQLQPTQENNGGEPPVPDADRGFYKDLVPGPFGGVSDPGITLR
jgi:hypothetical protein